jgi:hypothetical protein
MEPASASGVRCRDESATAGRRPPRQSLAGAPTLSVLPQGGSSGQLSRADFAALSVIVRLSSERARQGVRQDCCFAKKQQSPPALLVVVQTESELGAVPDARVRRGSSSVAGGCSTAARRFGWSAFRGGDEAVEFGGVDGGVVDAHRGEGRVRSRRRLPLRLTLQPLGWQGSAGYDGRAPRRPCRVLSPPLPTIRRHQERPARGRASGLARASPGA